MDNRTRAAVLMGCMSIKMGKKCFSKMRYEERRLLIESIVLLPIQNERDQVEVVAECYELITGEVMVNRKQYKELLNQLCETKETSVISYMKSLTATIKQSKR